MKPNPELHEPQYEPPIIWVVIGIVAIVIMFLWVTST